MCRVSQTRNFDHGNGKAESHMHLESSSVSIAAFESVIQSYSFLERASSSYDSAQLLHQ
jgi:hypothetical protein